MKVFITFCLFFSTLLIFNLSAATTKQKNDKKACLATNPKMKDKELKDCMNKQKNSGKSGKKKAKKRK